MSLSLYTAVSVTFFVLFIITIGIYWFVFHKDFVPNSIVTALRYTSGSAENPSNDRTVSNESYFDPSTIKDDLTPRSRTVSYASAQLVGVRVQTTPVEQFDKAIKSYTVSSTYLNDAVFVHVSHDTIRSYAVHCSQRSDVGKTLEAGLDDTFSPRFIARGSSVESKGVPTVHMSHVELHTVQDYNYLLAIWSYIVYLFWTTFDFILRWTPIIIALCACVVVINSWYVTLSQGDTTRAKALTDTLYSFCTFCLVGEFLLMIQGYRRGNRTVLMAHGMQWAYVLFCWILALELVYLTTGGNPAKQYSQSNDHSSSFSGPNWGPFNCLCDNHDRRLMANDYQWSCPSSNWSEICDTDCGVCGSPYYGTFVTFAIAFALYWLFALFYGFFSFYYDEMRITDYGIYGPDVHSHAHVTLHGSHAYGYPLHVKLTLDEGLALVKIFSRVHLEGDLGVKGPPSSIRDPSRPAPGIQKAVFDSSAFVGDAFNVMFKVGFELFKLIGMR